jgi:hypothetical protein
VFAGTERVVFALGASAATRSAVDTTATALASLAASASAVPVHRGRAAQSQQASVVPAGQQQAHQAAHPGLSLDELFLDAVGDVVTLKLSSALKSVDNQLKLLRQMHMSVVDIAVRGARCVCVRARVASHCDSPKGGCDAVACVQACVHHEDVQRRVQCGVRARRRHDEAAVVVVRGRVHRRSRGARGGVSVFDM